MYSIYKGYNPFTNHLLTSWDIQVLHPFVILPVSSQSRQSCPVIFESAVCRVSLVYLWVASLSEILKVDDFTLLITAPVSAYQNSQGLWKTSQASLTKRIEGNLKIMAFSSPEISFSNRKNMISGFQPFWKSHLLHTGCMRFGATRKKGMMRWRKPTELPRWGICMFSPSSFLCNAWLWWSYIMMGVSESINHLYVESR